MGEYNLNVRITTELRDRVSARAKGEVSLSEVVRRLLSAYAEGRVTVAPRLQGLPASSPPSHPPEPPERKKPGASPQPSPEETAEFKSDLMRRMREQG